MIPHKDINHAAIVADKYVEYIINTFYEEHSIMGLVKYTDLEKSWRHFNPGIRQNIHSGGSQYTLEGIWKLAKKYIQLALEKSGWYILELDTDYCLLMERDLVIKDVSIISLP